VEACEPSGKGKDYQVGTGTGQLASLDLVPWDKLVAGDTVRIFHRATPYKGKFMISGNGTAAAPIRVCGVKSSTGERPVIDGNGAVSRAGLAYGNILHETRSIILIKQLSNAAWTAYPTHIQVDGLTVRGANPANTFTDSKGVTNSYTNFGGCIWVERGHNITIADNVINDCTNGLFTKSTDDGEFAVTKDVRIAGNYFYGNGGVGSVHEHSAYVQSVNVVYEFNRFEPQRKGALGNMIKDRSAGAVIRYNYINGGARAIDLVEAQDFGTIATSIPAYRTTFVYGNVIKKNGGDGSAIHYGGDHLGSTPGANWGEPLFRKGTLYFYNNTMHITGTYGVAFQLSTTEEKAEVWNNIISFESTVTHPSLRSNSDVGANWTAGGIVNLGKNWAINTLADSDPWHIIPGTVTGWGNLLTGTSAPFDANSYIPLNNSSVVDAAVANPAAVAAHPVLYQMDLSTFTGKPRTVKGGGMDLGAIER
jgi:hypothetical protein